MKPIYTLSLLVLLLFSPLVNLFPQNYLSVSGNKLIDSKGNTVRLTGVNWFGFETNLKVPHGLWTRDCKSMLQQIKDLGFNSIRFPWSNDILLSGATISLSSFGTDPYTNVSPMNEVESTFTTPLQLLDKIVEYCQELNLKIILDNHSRTSDNYLNEKLWYTSSVTEAKWISDWVTLATRYKNNDAVIGMDLDNEPNGSSGQGSTWGNSNSLTDWNKAAERCGDSILKVNPNVLIIVEGVQTYNGDSYWWGGNLAGVADYPVVLSNPNKLVYSPHEYGPEVFNSTWFSDATFPNNMAAIWNTHFNFIYSNNTAPLLVGEFGIKDTTSYSGNEVKWFDTFLAYMGSRYSWTFWCWNPNSGDTGGLLDDQWANPVAWKINRLKPYMAAEISNTSTSADSVAVTGVSVSPTSTTIALNGTVQLTATILPSNATVKSVTWSSGNTDVATVSSAGLVTGVAAGSAIITVTTTDGSYTATSTITVTESSSSSCTFGTPLSTPLPTINASYKYVYVLGSGGPSLTNVTTFTINWNLTDNGLYQFSVNTNDGNPNWYVDLRTGATQTFASAQPAITLSGTGFTGLNGTYYATTDNGNFVWVSTTGSFAIYFSNSATTPTCTKSGSALLSAAIAENEVTLYPNPFTDEVTLHAESISSVKVYDQLGRIVLLLKGSDLESNAVTFGKDLSKGVYIVKISRGNLMDSYKLVKQ
jgi:endoglucanase